MNERILIVEDDLDIASVERDYLEINEFLVTIETDGLRGLAQAQSGTYDLVILDLMLPGMDGMEVCRRLRATSDVPVLVVSARTSDVDQVKALGLGADHYMLKPFSPSVLVAQVKSLIARYQGLKGPGRQTGSILVDGLALDPATHQASLDGEVLDLKNREFQLLLFLAQHPGVVFDRDALYEKVWGLDAAGDSSTVAVHINRLRSKVERDPRNPEFILTVRGAGYQFKPRP